MIDIPDVELYRPILEAELKRHAVRPVELMVVEDIPQWSQARGQPMRVNPSAMAITGVDGAWGILLRRSLDPATIGSVLDGMFVRGFFEVKEQLTSAELFLKHTVLHELAHLQNNWRQERETDCDRWAFEKLKVHAI